jgi:hypothetical protein
MAGAEKREIPDCPNPTRDVLRPGKAYGETRRVVESRLMGRDLDDYGRLRSASQVSREI